MPLIRRSYLDLKPHQRAAGAKAARDKINAALANPDLTAEQVKHLRKQMEMIKLWENGQLSHKSEPAKNIKAKSEQVQAFIERQKANKK